MSIISFKDDISSKKKITGSSSKDLFNGSITDKAIVKIKEGSTCIVEGKDKILRTITDCSYKMTLS